MIGQTIRQQKKACLESVYKLPLLVFAVILAKAGIQCFQYVLDPRFHGDDKQETFINKLYLSGLTILLMLAANSGCAPAFHADLDAALSGRLVWPAPPEKPRIEYLWSLYSFLPKGEKLEDYMADAVGVGNIMADLPYMLRPNSLCVDDRDRLFIVDQGVPRVTAVDLKSREVKHFGFEGGGILYMPIAVAADTAGTVYVTDSEAKKVNRYSSEGVFNGTLGSEDFFQRPTGITFERKTGRIYVVDTALHRVQAFDSKGTSLFHFGSRGAGDGQFNYPTHISAGHDGKIYVNDEMNFRVQVFDSDGRFLGKFGRHGDSYSDLEKPKGIAADGFGNIYVVDALQDMIKIFDSSGRLLLFIGENGRNPGNFFMPNGIFVDSQNRIYVADTYNMRIQAFRLIATDRL